MKASAAATVARAVPYSLEDGEVMMESIRNTFFMLVFMWMGIIFTKTTLDGTPKDEWLSATIRLGLMITVLVVVLELMYQGLKRRQRRNQASVVRN